MRFRNIFFLSVLFLLIVPVSFSEAASCECFCKSSAGAVSKGEQTDSASCRSICDSGYYLGCYSEDQEKLKPENDSKCYDEYECINDTTEIDGEEMASEWGGQEPSCPSGQGYCYAATSAVTLAVSVIAPGSSDATTEVSDLADYINVIYNFLIPAASLLAIVMIMIGGLQYMLARGNSGKIENAKKRIRNAVVGLILLLCSVSIAQFVGPEYVELSRLQPPKVRTITFIDPNSSCEALRDAGYTVELIEDDPEAAEECGYQGEVTVPDDIGDTTWSDGDKCDFNGCEENFQSCVRSTETESGYDCVRCYEAFAVGLTPSASVCNSLKYEPTTEDDPSEHYYCEYWETGWLDLEFDMCVELVYPGDVTGIGDSLDCTVLGQDYEYSCRGYDEVWSFAPSVSDVLNELDDIDGEDNAFPYIHQVCEDDPCGFAPPGEKCQVLIPSELGGIEDACSGVWGYLPYCEDIQAEIERVDCVNSSYYDLFSAKVEAINNDEDPSELEDPKCLNSKGEEIDCMITI